MKLESLTGKPYRGIVVCYTNDIWSSALSEVRQKAPLEAAGFQVVRGNDSYICCKIPDCLLGCARMPGLPALPNLGTAPVYITVKEC